MCHGEEGKARDVQCPRSKCMHLRICASEQLSRASELGNEKPCKNVAKERRNIGERKIRSLWWQNKTEHPIGVLEGKV